MRWGQRPRWPSPEDLGLQVPDIMGLSERTRRFVGRYAGQTEPSATSPHLAPMTSRLPQPPCRIFSYNVDNDPCSGGSGKKYKKCCLVKDENR